jgi:SAM-dependent methyltransferase
MAFQELKNQQAATWDAGSFERIAWTLADMHETIVAAVDGSPGEAWLDVGCGTGELAFMAAATGADVTGCDLAVGLLETAKRQAAERSHAIAFDVGDAEALPYDDANFDIVTSSIAAIFAPDHEAAAAELARVCRPGGRLGMTAWTSPGDSVDRFFEIIGSYAPPPPPGAGMPMAWGDPVYCETLLGPSFDLTITAHNCEWRADSADEVWTLLTESFGPIKMLLANLPPDRANALREEMQAYLAEEQTADGLAMDRFYNLILGTRKL